MTNDPVTLMNSVPIGKPVPNRSLIQPPTR